MEKLSPQKEIIVSALRSGKWVCGRTWVDRIKDDRIRITELNRGYMASKGWEIVGEPCRGRACCRNKCPLYMRKAVKKGVILSHETVKLTPKTLQEQIQTSLDWYKSLPETPQEGRAYQAQRPSLAALSRHSN